MTNHEEKDYYKRKKCKKEAANIIEEVIHNEIFIAKGKSKKYDSETFIVDYEATSPMAKSEENMTNL